MHLIKALLDIKKILTWLWLILGHLKKNKRAVRRIHTGATLVLAIAFCSIVIFRQSIHDYFVAIRPSENLISNTLNQCGKGSMITWISIYDRPYKLKRMFFKSAQFCEKECLTDGTNPNQCRKKDCVGNAFDVNSSLYALERVIDQSALNFFKGHRELTLVINGQIIFDPITNVQLQYVLPQIVPQLLSMTNKKVEVIKIFTSVDALGKVSNIFTFSYYEGAERLCTEPYIDGILRALVNNLQEIL